MIDNITETLWFVCGFHDVAQDVAVGSISSSEACNIVDERIRMRLKADLWRRGLRTMVRHIDDIMQQFWLRMLGGRVIEQFDPARASPWAMIYLNLRGATSDVYSERCRIVSDDFATKIALEGVMAPTRNDVDDSDMCSRLAILANQLPDAWRGALLSKHPILWEYGMKEAEAGKNEAVDRSRATAWLRMQDAR